MNRSLPIVSSIYVLIHYRRRQLHQRQQQHTNENRLVVTNQSSSTAIINQWSVFSSCNSLRKAHLVQAFSNQWFEPFVAIKPRFAKADETSYPHGYVGPLKVLGSGYIFDDQRGLIVTHIKSVAYYTLVKVRMSNGQHLNGRVALRMADQQLAIIKLDDDSIKEYGRPLRSADCEDLVDQQTAIGQQIYAVANAGPFVQCLTVGRIGRIQNLKDGLFSHSADLDNDSYGNPLVNRYGKLIGFNLNRYNVFRNQAITTKIVNEYLDKVENLLVDEMRAFGLVVSWFDGKNRHELNNYIRSKHTGPNPVPEIHPNAVPGAVVMLITMGSTAHKQLKIGDVITRIDGTNVRSLADMYDPLNDDYDCRIEFWRNGNDKPESVIVRRTDKISRFV